MRIPVGQGPLSLCGSREWEVEQYSRSTAENKHELEVPGRGAESSRSAPAPGETGRADGCVEKQVPALGDLCLRGRSWRWKRASWLVRLMKKS